MNSFILIQDNDDIFQAILTIDVGFLGSILNSNETGLGELNFDCLLNYVHIF